MLILRRRIGETLNIGEDIEITILGINNNRVRIGIGAPKTVEVWRNEIYQRIKEKQRQGQSSTHTGLLRDENGRVDAKDR